MARRPGGELATRPLHFIWMCDCSGSMSYDGKIQALNNAIREAVPHMRQVADENPFADVFVRCLKFSHGAAWHIPIPTPLADFRWHNLVADPLAKASLDIVFMVDTSGSMSGEIKSVRTSCVAFADRIIATGANVRLGLVGFGIGGHSRQEAQAYKVRNLSTYTIGSWPLAAPHQFRDNIQSFKLRLFGGRGCYLANRETVDIFPHVVRVFDGPPENERILVIISDELGNTTGLSEIVAHLKRASITAHVLGVPGSRGAHESLAQLTGGKFWDIVRSKGRQDFDRLLDTVATTIAQEVSRRLADGSTSAGTDAGAALRMVADELRMPPMTDRALPPVLVLVSDGRPTDDFRSGLKVLMEQPWGKKAVRIGIAIGEDADHSVLQAFIGYPHIRPLHANNPEALARQIKWVSTAVLQSASAPASQAWGTPTPAMNVPIPIAPE